MSAARRPIGTLGHKDFGKIVTVPGHGPGILWAVQHTAAFGDIPQAWTRVTIAPTRGGGSEATKGLPVWTIVLVEPSPAVPAIGQEGQ